MLCFQVSKFETDMLKNNGYFEDRLDIKKYVRYFLFPEVLFSLEWA